MVLMGINEKTPCDNPMCNDILNVTNVNTYSSSTAHSSSDNEALVGMGRSVFAKLQLRF